MALIWLLIQSVPSPSPGVSSLWCDHMAWGDQQTAGVLFCWLRQVENCSFSLYQRTDNGVVFCPLQGVGAPGFCWVPTSWKKRMFSVRLLTPGLCYAWIQLRKGAVLSPCSITVQNWGPVPKITCQSQPFGSFPQWQTCSSASRYTGPLEEAGML